MSRCISILGSTGSIGRQSLDVIAACGMRAAALTANRSVRELEEQARRFRPELAVMMDPAAAAAICARPEADFILGSIHNLCPEKGGTDLYYVPYPDEAACHAVLDDYFASMALLAATDFYDVLAHIIYPLRYMDVPVSLDRYEGRLRAILRTAVERGRGVEINTCRGHTLAEWRPVLALYRACGGEIVTVGSDAHTPGDVGKGIRSACALLADCGFRYVCTYEKHKPVFHKL